MNLGRKGHDKETDNEMLDLQRKYKNIENDRKAFSEETSA